MSKLSSEGLFDDRPMATCAFAKYPFRVISWQRCGIVLGACCKDAYEVEQSCGANFDSGSPRSIEQKFWLYQYRRGVPFLMLPCRLFEY